MFRAATADTDAVARSTFFTNHLRVLAVVIRQPDVKLNEIAREVGITERATHRIITELVADGYIDRTRVGARNRYELRPGALPRDFLQTERVPPEVLRLVAGAEPVDDASDGSELLIAPDLPDSRPSRFREAFLTAPVGIAMADASGRMIKVNAALCALLGFTESELCDRALRELTPAEDTAALDQGLAQLTRGERADYVTEMRCLGRRASPVWVELRVSTATDPHTGAMLLLAHIVDISERRRHTNVLAEAEERFRSAFDNAPIGMALVAPDGRWLKVNRSLCELTGYTETALLVSTFQSITHPEDLDTDLAYVEDVLAGRRRAYQMEKRYRHADGHLIWVRLYGSLVRDAAGDPLYFISQIEDVTERRRRETARPETASDLTALVGAR